MCQLVLVRVLKLWKCPRLDGHADECSVADVHLSLSRRQGLGCICVFPCLDWTTRSGSVEHASPSN